MPEIISLPPPQGLDHWRSRLAMPQLTLLPGSFERITQALHARNSNAEKVAQAIAADPAACLHFFLRANRMVARTGNEIHTLPHLISLLGFPYTGQLLNALPVAERPLPHYWRQLQESLLRHSLLHALPMGQAGFDVPALQFSVLFSGLPRWLLWHFAAREQLHLEGLARNPHIGPTKAAQLIYGHPLPWSHWLADSALPRPLLEALAQSRHERLALVRSLLRAHANLAAEPVTHRRSALIFLLDELCRCYVQAPMHRRVMRLATMLAQLLQTNTDKILCALHQQTGQLASLHPTLVPLHPARLLLACVSERPRKPIYALPGKPSDTTTKAKASQGYKQSNKSAEHSRLLDNRFVDAAKVKQSLAELTNPQQPIPSLNALMTLWRDALIQGVGMSMCCALIPTPNQRQWQVRFQHGKHPLSPLDTSPVLAKLAGQSGSLLINQDNRAAMANHLPPPLATLAEDNQLLLHSIHANQKPVAILLCGEPDFSPPRVRACKQFNAALQAAVTRLARQLYRRAQSR